VSAVPNTPSKRTTRNTKFSPKKKSYSKLQKPLPGTTYYW